MLLWFAILTVSCFLYTRAIHRTAYPMQCRIRTINSRPGLNKTTAEYFSRSRKMIKKYQQSCPFIKAVGWDVAITDDGPVIIEMNDFWDRTGQLFIGKGWRHDIRDCYLEWGKVMYSPIIERFLPNMSKKMVRRMIEL